MNTGQHTDKGSTQFLNFSDALNHLRWGDCIARRSWPKGQTVVVDYRISPATIRVEGTGRGIAEHFLSGSNLLAEDWYVV